MRMAVGALLILFIVGLGLIWFIYGFPAAVMGLVCVLAGLVPIVLILVLLNFSDWILKRAGRSDD